MKRTLAIILTVIIFAAAVAGCAPAPTAPAISANIRLTSSDAESAAAWLTARLGDVPDRIVLGTNADSYGVDVSTLESDGYFIRHLGGEVALFAKTADGLDRAVRKYAKTVEAGEAIADTTYHEGYRVKRLTIAGNDVSEYAIVRADGASERTAQAAGELMNYINMTCGAPLSTLTESEYAALAEKPRRITLTEGDEALGDEGYTITVDEAGELHIDGGKWRGTLFGVYDLLEQDIGWRFLGTGGSLFGGGQFIRAADRTYLYEAEHIDLTAAINRTEIPSIPIRGFVNYGGDYGRREQKSSYSWHVGFANYAVHGLQINHDEIFCGDYAELYDPAYGLQPCFTDEDVLEAIDHYALEYVRTRLDAGQEIGKELFAVDVAQWDGKGFCQCRNCAKVERVEGCVTGAYLRMANRVCALLDENYPGMCASILAYYGSEQLPALTRPAHNLYVAFCFYVGRFYAGCQNHCISGVDCSNNANNVLAKYFEEWANVMDGSMIQIWLYPSNCYNVCYNAPQFFPLLDDAKYLASFGVGHILHDTSWINNGNILEELSVYLLHRFEWDATLTKEDARALMREWFELVYGDAGDLLYELAVLSEQAGDLKGCWCSFARGSSDSRVDYDFISEHAEKIWDACDNARKMAASAAEEERIEKNVAGFLFMTLRARYDDMYVNGTDEEREYITARYREVWELFAKHHLATYTTLNSTYFAPETFDPDVDPRGWIDNSIHSDLLT